MTFLEKVYFQLWRFKDWYISYTNNAWSQFGRSESWHFGVPWGWLVWMMVTFGVFGLFAFILHYIAWLLDLIVGLFL